MTETVLLHKDKHMKQARADIVKQPVQLDLWQTLVSENYSNSVELYQTLPDVFVGKQDKLRNLDGTLPLLTRKGIYNGTPYTLDITPAHIGVAGSGNNKIKKAFYKNTTAEFVEYALHKLSIAEGFFMPDSLRDTEFALITNFYKIRTELKKMGKTYSYEQIKDGISILAGLRYQLSGEMSKNHGLDSFFSPIDLIIKNDKKNPSHSELYINFNKLISKKILSLDWRGFNYTEFMKVKTSFGRSLFMRLSHRFKQVDTIKGYHFLLSTMIDEGLLQEDLITTNIKKINEGLKDCSYIIDHFKIEEKRGINPQTKRKALVDYKVTVFPTKDFQQEQWRINTHHKNIKNHRINESGKAVIKPLRDQYPTGHDYDRYVDDCDTFEKAREPIDN